MWRWGRDGTVADSEGRNVPTQHYLNGPLNGPLTDIRAGELGPPLGLGESGKESGQGRPSKLEAVAQGRSKSPKQMARGSKALHQMWV